MKSALVLIPLCMGVGVALAYKDVNQWNHGLKHHMAGSPNLDETVAKLREGDGGKLGSVIVEGGDSLQFGTMRRGSVKQHTFVIKNTGETDVEVFFKASSCKCTVGKFERATLKPGETTDVELEWKAEGFGEFAQTATLGTTIPGKEEIKLTINGQITEAVSFDPPSLELGDFLSNATHEFNGKILNFGDTPIRLSDITLADPRIAPKFDITFSEARPPKEDELTGLDDAKEVIEFQVKVDKGLPSGNINTHLNFHVEEATEASPSLSAEDFPSYKVNGRCLNPIRIIAGTRYDESRDILDMGIAPSSEGIKISFVFGIRTDEFPNAAIKAKSITPEAAANVLKVTVGEPNTTKNQKLFPVTVEIPPGTPPIEFNGASGKEFVKLTFDTNMEDSPEESIYLKFVIQP